jgi:hypothetical protein
VGWTLATDFEAGTPGIKCDVDNFNAAMDLSTTSTAEYHSGGKSCRFFAENGSDDWGSQMMNWSDPLEEGEEIWMSLWIYFPEAFEQGCDGSCGGGLKFMRIHIEEPGTEANGGYNDFYINNGPSNGRYWWRYEGAIPEGDHTTHFGTGYEIVKDTWTHYEFYVYLDSDNGEGITRIWKDGDLMFENTTIKTVKYSGWVSDRGAFFNYWNGTPDGDQFLYVDDIHITDEEPDDLCDDTVNSGGDDTYPCIGIYAWEGSGPTPTPTATPSITPTPTATPSASASPSPSPSPSPTATPTATPTWEPGAFAYWAMDFEGAGTTTAIDTNPAYVIETVEGGFDADCTAAECPITGTYSGRTGIDGGGLKTSTITGRRNVIHDFVWKWIDDAGTDLRHFAMMQNAEEQWLCGISFDEDEERLKSKSLTAAGPSPSDIISKDTLYYIRVRIQDQDDETFDCDVYVDTSAIYGTGNFYTSEISGDYSYPDDYYHLISGVAYFGGFSDSHADDFDFIIDEIILCDEGAVGPVPDDGTQCTVPTAVPTPTPTATPSATPSATATPTADPNEPTGVLAWQPFDWKIFR